MLLKQLSLVVIALALMLAPVLSFAQEATGYNPEDSVSIAAARVRPSVVAIETRFKEPLLKDDYAYWQYLRGARPLYGLWGSGIIYEDPQYVLTDDFLMSDAEYIRVILDDGRSYKAELVGKNSDFNFAVLKVEWGPDLEPQPASMGDSDMLKLGQPVGVVGKALNSVDTFASAGIISALRKHVPGSEEQTDEMLQFDASYQLSFIGGPLVDIYGNVVGMVHRSQGGANINFAIPINEILFYADKIIEGNDIDIWFGVESTWMSSGLVEKGLAPATVDFGDGEGERELDFGQWVSYVDINSPCDIAGILAGDTIVKLDDVIIDQKYTWRRIFRDFEVGQLVTVHFLRKDEMSGTWELLQTEVQIEEEPEESDDEDSGGGSSSSGMSNPHGFSLGTD